VLEPLGPGSAATTLLIRAAAYVRHPNQYSTVFDLVTMAPRIDGPPFVRALEELLAAHAMNPGPALERDVAAVRRDLLAGHAAAAICWPQPATAAAMGETTATSATGDMAAGDMAAGDTAAGDMAIGDMAVGTAVFGVAPLPGARDVFNADQRKWEPRAEDEQNVPVPVWAVSGRLGGVLATSRRGGAAANLLALVSTASWGRKVLATGSHAGISRLEHLERPDDWVDAALAGEPARQFATVVGDSQRLSTWMAIPRIPGRERYLAALDDAVRSAVRGEQTATESLAAAAKRWRDITAELGRDSQKQAYRRCLGIEK
jgi:multiple sugar transport system substrate-binding protein